MTTNNDQWLRTPAAAVALGCSQNHLKRCRDSHGGFLVGGEHYILGTSHSAAILWNVDAIRIAFHEVGLKRTIEKTRSSKETIESYDN